MGFLCGGETWTRVGPPIPSSPVNAMAKGAPKSGGATPPKAQGAQAAQAQATTGATAPAPAAPKAAGATKPGQKGTADPVGDICLLPEIAGFAH
jgi:hypothetical protein